MSRSALLARARLAAERGMSDTCLIRRPNGRIENPDTGESENQYITLYESSKCRLQTKGYWGEVRDIGQAGLVYWTIEVQLPISVTDLLVHDEVVMLTSIHDPDHLGAVLKIRDMNHKTDASARRVLCTEVTG